MCKARNGKEEGEGSHRVMGVATREALMDIQVAAQQVFDKLDCIIKWYRKKSPILGSDWETVSSFYLFIYFILSCDMYVKMSPTGTLAVEYGNFWPCL